ncbi:MAG: CdaR family protein [Deltaproteobacteria bacterium]|nr:CdaR family protein [Deltaproteobacteria bacterium]
MNWKELIVKNWPQKILAIVFAMIVWALAPSPNKEAQTEMQFFVPVTYANLPKTLEIISDPIQSVSISVATSQSDLQNLHPSLFQAVIDLHDATGGEKVYAVTEKNIKTPPNVRVNKISPDSVKLAFEDTIEKELPIHVVISGEPAKGFAVSEVILEPKVVKVHGPVSKLSGVLQLETKSISIEGVSSDIEMLVYILFPERVVPIEPKPDFFIARIKFGSEPIKMRFEKIPIGLVNQTYVTRINPKKFNALLRGPKKLLEQMEISDIQAVIDLNHYKPGTYKIKTPTIRTRSEVKVLETWPPIDIWVLNQKIYE